MRGELLQFKFHYCSINLRYGLLYAGHVFDVINALPKTAHPMTQLTAGIMALQVLLQRETVQIFDRVKV